MKFDIRAQLESQQPPWLSARTIYATLHGSHAYGTALPTSDVDVRGLAIAPPEYYLGASLAFEQADCHDPDVTIFDLRKFFKLAEACNPNALETIFTDPSDHLLTTPWVTPLLEHRNLFLSRRAKHTFSGYARAQLRRIQGHYRWLKDPPKAPPERKAFGLPEQPVIPTEQRDAYMAAIQAKVDSWQLDLSGVEPAVKIDILGHLQDFMTEIEASGSDLQDRAGRAVGLPENVVAELGRERAFHNAVKQWNQYLDWQRTRNATRAALEAKSGYDTKHAAHLVRLMRMGQEILAGRGCIVRRPDADELLAIRAGAWTYEQVLAYADAAEAAMTHTKETSPLPDTPPRRQLDGLCQALITEFLSRHGDFERLRWPTVHAFEV